LNDEQSGNAIEAFAAELRAWRSRLDLSQGDLGAHMGYSGSHVSSIETLHRTPVLEFAKKCDEVMGTPGTFVRLHKLITREAYPPWFAPFVHFEQAASRMHNWDPRCFTGLLQTEAYARAIIRAAHPEASDDEVERDVAARMDRQRILDHEQPPSCWFVIGEAAFRARFGGDDVMRAQMRHVAALAALPRITIQVYPFNVSDCPGIDGPVTVFDVEGQQSAGYAEGYEAGRTIEASQDMASLVTMFDHLRAAALSPGDSASWIAAHRSEHYGE
jgi:transcriptional regulator with XRE-family HTH domain